MTEMANRESELDELSLTLIERRKRLHDLASEINQWQDESNKHLMGTPTAPPLPSDMLLKAAGTNSAHASPKTTIMGRSPSPYGTHYQSTNNNKENKTPTNNNQPKRIVTPSSNEILTVAQRILAKRNSNAEPTTAPVVKSLRDKFESKHDESISVENMTPKLLIKKFEQLSSNGAHPAVKKLAEKKSTTSFVPNVAKCEPVRVVDEEDDLLNKPKSIIQKFEQLTKNCAKPTSQVTYVSTTNNSIAGSASLTYVSSIQSSANSSPELENEYFDYEKDKPTPPPPHFMDGDETTELTSLFERSSSGSSSSSIRRVNDDYEDDDDDDRESMATSSYNTQDAYSISGSSYTGSLINRDEFEDEEENTTYGDEEGTMEQQTDDYDSINDTTSQQYDGETTVSQTITASEMTPTPPTTTTTTTSASSSNDTGSSSAATTSSVDSEPLFSIKEYRKQTRTMRHGRRRSSLMPKANNANSTGSAKDKSNRQTTNKTANGSGLPAVPENSDDQNKKLKYLERIKELEEFIKQEDNVIYQTGIALEKCLSDAQFTGSSEHIECNRILLISCQKRQAFLTEVNRLKQLASNPHLQPNRSTNTNDTHSNDSSDISSSDLTGLLIFSDLQLPIKESYINKLKSGDEKRLFYFICLIRNGIQVLQTQVISVQEIISTKESSITFPNRMAINNVDINFKVKIDIYAMEVLPKDTKTKQSTHSTHTSSKFFSPFKNNLFSSHHHGTQSNSHQNHNSQLSNGQHSSGISSLGAKTSNFIHIDTVEITNRDIYTNKFKLNISSSSIPLGGLLFVNVRCMPSKSIELKGFMTLFEDVNGLGSWDRRWCFLNNYSISYWKYPEDEYRNGPLGTINLTKCINESVTLLPRDLCARKHTIELIIYEVEPSNVNECAAELASKSDKFKYKRFRLSADTKDQANDWLTNINYALANLRIWNPKAMKPVKK